MNDPYITFSDDMRYAFVEYSGAISTRARALAELDRYLDHGWRPEVPLFQRWSADDARVVGLEIWDEATGDCLAYPVARGRALWRVAIGDALVCTDPAGSVATEDLVGSLRALNHAGELADDALARIEILLTAFEDVEQDRCARQADRAPGAPRAQPLSSVGTMLATTLLALIIELDGRAGATEWEAIHRTLTAFVDDEAERQVAELRAELDACDLDLH